MKISTSRSDSVFVVISYIIVIVVAFLCFYPFWFMLINSFATREAAVQGVFIFPGRGEFSFDTYMAIFRDGDVFRGMAVSVMRVLVSTVGGIVFSAMFAFLITRQKLPFRKVIYRFAIITMYVNAGLIPWYLVMRMYGLFNNFHVYWVPHMINVFFVILIKTYIESIPPALEDSARVDGAGFFKTFFIIILPLSKPILATAALFMAVHQWNSFIDNFLLVQNPNLQTVQMILFNYLRQTESIANAMRNAATTGGISDIMIQNLRNNMTVESVRNTITIIAMAPIMVIYPFLQKYFAGGIMLGAVKG